MIVYIAWLSINGHFFEKTFLTYEECEHAQVEHMRAKRFLPGERRGAMGCEGTVLEDTLVIVIDGKLNT